MKTAQQAKEESNRNNILLDQEIRNREEREESLKTALSYIDEIEKKIDDAILLEQFEISTEEFLSYVSQHSAEALFIEEKIESHFLSLGYKVSKGMCDVTNSFPRNFFIIYWK